MSKKPRSEHERKTKHHPDCEIVGLGSCTCDYWDALDDSNGQTVELYHGVNVPYPNKVFPSK